MDKFKKGGSDLFGKIKGAAASGGSSAAREQGKFQFDIRIYHADTLPLNSGLLYVSWKRGSKSTSNGKTRAMPIIDKKAIFDHNVQMTTTLLKTPKKTYESKNVSISIKEDKGKKGSTVGKTIIDLAEFTTSKDEQRKVIQIKPKKGKTPFNFVLGVKATELQIGPDEEPMTETDLNSNDGSDDEEEVEDFTQDDDSDISSSTSHSTAVDHNSNVTTPSPSLVKTSSSSSISPSSSPLARLAEKKQEKEKEKEKEQPKGLSSLLSKDSSSSSSSSSSVADKKRISELEKQLADLQKIKSNSSASSSSSGEVADLKKRIKELAGENVDLEDKVKELEERLESGGGGGSITGASPSASHQRQINDLQDQIRQKDDTIRQKEEMIRQKENSALELNQKNRQLERDFQDLQSKQRATSPTIISSPSSQSNNNNEEIESLKKEIHQLKLEAASQLSPANAGGSAMVGGGTLELKRKIQDLNREIKDRDDQISKLKSNGGGGSTPTQQVVAAATPSLALAKLEKEAQELNKTIASQKQEIERLKDMNTTMSKNAASSSKSSSPNGNEESLKREITDVKDRLSSTQSELNATQDKLERAEQELRYKTEDLQDTEVRLGRRIADLEETKDQLENRLNSQTASAASLSMMGSSKSDKSKDKDRERDRQEREVAEKALEKEKMELAKEREKVKKLEREVKDLKDRIRQLEQSSPSASYGGSSPNGSGGQSTVAKSDLQEREENRIIEQCIYTQTLTFRDGVGASAYSLYHQLLDQNAFSQENSRLFNKVINGLTQTVEKSMENLVDLSYWLSNISGLIHLIKDGPNNIDNDRDPLLDGVLIDQEIAAPSTSSRRTPSTAFYYQLESLCRETYSLLLHNIFKKLKSKITNIYQQCLIVDKKSNRLSLSHTNDLNKICKVLEKSMTVLKDKYVFDSIIQQIFSQTFHYISNTLLNDIMDGGANNACSPSSGFKIKLSLSKIEDWVASSEERDLLTHCRMHLGGIADAANLMVIDKSLFTDTESIQSAFTTLNILQIKKLLEIWKPDQFSPDPIPSSVLAMSRSHWNRPIQSLQLQLDPSILINIIPILD